QPEPLSLLKTLFSETSRDLTREHTKLPTVKLARPLIACYPQVLSPCKSKEVRMRMSVMALMALAVVFAVSLLSAPVTIQQSQIEKDAGLGVLSSNSQKGGEEETGPYEVVPKWPQPFAPPGYIQGSQGGVFAESPNRIFIANRGEIKLPEKLPNN